LEVRPTSLDLLVDFFFLLELFLPELKSSEERILKRNPARKKREAGARADYPIPTSNRSTNELL
jgi:hypothetical protein